MNIEILVESEYNPHILAYFTKGHIDKNEFINELQDYHDLEDEIAIEDIEHKYGKWIPNPDYDDDEDVFDERDTFKIDYFPITIYSKC